MTTTETWQTILDRLDKLDPDRSDVTVREILAHGVDRAFDLAAKGQVIARQVTAGLTRPE